MKPHVVVIDPALKRPELEALATISALSSLPVSYHLPALYGMDSLTPISKDSCAGLIVLGSLASVNEALDWQTQLSKWLKPKMDSAVPTLGICYGHQLIATLFGARVGFVSPLKKRLQGVRKLVLDANALWGGQATQGWVCVSHEETVLGVPLGMESIGHSEEIIHDALTHLTLPIWTFQSHPEATPAFFQLRGLPMPSVNPFSFGHDLLKRFLDFVAKQL